MPTLTALWDLVLTHGSTPLTCGPLAAVEHIPSAAHLLPFGLVLRLHLLAGHVATEAGLDLGGGPVGLRIIQGDVHDVLLLLGPAAFLLLRGLKKEVARQRQSTHCGITSGWPFSVKLSSLCGRMFCYLSTTAHSSEGLDVRSLPMRLGIITCFQSCSQKVNNTVSYSLSPLPHTQLVKTCLSQPVSWLICNLPGKS